MDKIKKGYKGVLSGEHKFYEILLVFLVYFICGKMSLYFSAINPSVSVVWIPTAISFTAFIFFGYRVWPAIFFGAFFTNVTTQNYLLVSLFIAAGNTLEGYVGGYLVNKFCGGREVFDSVENFYKFIFFAAIGATAVSATIGVSSLCLGGIGDCSKFGPIWSTWWLGDATGAIIFTPALLYWLLSPRVRFNFYRVLELISIVLVGTVACLIMISYSFAFSFLLLPFFFWLAYRFRPRNVATFLAILSSILVIVPQYNNASLIGSLPYHQYLLYIQLFIAITNATILPLSILLFVQKKENKIGNEVISIIESASIAMISITLDGTITFWNSGAHDLYGYVEEEMIGRSVYDIVPSDKKEEFHQIIKKIKKGIPSESIETTRIAKGGKEIEVIVTDAPIFDRDANVIGLSAVALTASAINKATHDIINEKRMLEEKYRKQFIQNLTHEIRTPLAIIKGNVDVDLKSKTGTLSSLKKAVNAIDNEIKRITNIVEQATSVYDRDESKETKWEKYTKVRPIDTIKTAVENIKKIKGKSKFSVSYKDEYGGMMLGDKEELVKLFAILFENSVIYNDKMCEVVVNIEAHDDKIKIEIKDNGIGISAEDLPHIFEEFYKSEKSRTRSDNNAGLGLGLWNAKSIIEAHNGSVEVMSEPGKGTTFEIFFPKAQ